ncbi:restriction endonuclease subunit S [Halomonas halmophila]|uniref:Type I restriction modification DNA specificity domain-containing protein n=1 Tax=Halomonas halmophila TaxID=252 RepID=A0A4Y4F376_9GAMM|nr:restriction endonuclease subunit S [Halomonas halmophila]GED21591.1 hypothetical protein HHA01_05680 [Halomonas halmophila]
MSERVVPEGWVLTELENCVEILDSQRIPVNSKERKQRIDGKAEEELYPYYGATGQVGKIDGYIFDEELVALGEDGVPFLEAGKKKAYPFFGKAWVNNHAHVLKGVGEICLNSYLIHYLNSFDYHGYVNGGTRLKLTQKNMRRMPVLLAPPLEQVEIVRSLRGLLSQVNNLKARLDAIPAILKRFRRSVLAAAVSGELREDKIKEIKFEAIKLSDISLSAKTGLVRGAKEQYSYAEIGFPYIKMGDISNEWGYGLEDIVYVSASQEEYENYSLKNGDWLFNTRNSSDLVGKSCVWRSGEGYLYNNNILRVRLVEDYLAEYLDVWFHSPLGQKALANIKSATTSVAAIYQKKLMEVRVDFPSTEEQRKIVRRVDQLFVFADRVEKQVEAAQARVDKLTQSILARAFRGELTADWRAENPELISGEHSAEALLERIKAEKAKLNPAKSRRRSTNTNTAEGES